MKVKICGITDVQTAIETARCGADAIGLVFADSKRKVAIETAREIVQHVPDNIMKVGVFVNESKAEIEKIAAMVGLTHIQLHGEESAAFSTSLPLPVIKAVSIRDQESLADIIDFPCDYLLVDGPKGKYHGGNGTAFDWNTFSNEDFKGRKIILAGGLTVENVEAGIKALCPFMVDVSSGVETNGRKDIAKIKSFIEKAKGSLIGGKSE